jgi:Exonuclease VII small subunit.
MDIEQDIKKLDAIVAELSNKSMTLDDSLKLYGEAVTLAKKCVDGIKESKGKLELLTAELEKIDLDSEESR